MQRRSRVLFSPGSHCLSANLVSSRAHASHDATMADEVHDHENSIDHHEEIACSSASVATPTLSKTRTWKAGNPIIFSPSRPHAPDHTWSRSSPICFHDARSYSNSLPQPRLATSRPHALNPARRKGIPAENATSRAAFARPQRKPGGNQRELIKSVSNKPATVSDPTSKHALTRPQPKPGVNQQELTNSVPDQPVTASLSREGSEASRTTLQDEDSELQDDDAGLLYDEDARLKQEMFNLNAEITEKEEQNQYQRNLESQVQDRVLERTKDIQRAKAEAERVADKVPALEASVAELKAIVARSVAEREPARRESERLREELAQARQRQQEENRNKREVLESEHTRRSQRTEYLDYRHHFREVKRTVDLFLRYWSVDSNEPREKYWAQAIRDFDCFRDKQSATWFDPLFPGILDKIGEYVKDNSIRPIKTEYHTPPSELSDLFRRADHEAHWSRLITRGLRFDHISGTNFPALTEIHRKAVHIMTVFPTRVSHDRLILRKEQLERRAETSKQDGESDAMKEESRLLGEQARILDTSETKMMRRLVSLRISNLPDAYKVTAKDVHEILQIKNKMDRDFDKATSRLRKANTTGNFPYQLEPVFELYRRVADAKISIVDNTTILRIAQANRGLLAKENVRSADLDLREEKEEDDESASRRIPRVQNEVVGDDEASEVQERVDENVSILRLAKELAKQRLVTEDRILPVRISKFISRFESNRHRTTQLDAVRLCDRSGLIKKMELALATRDSTKFGPKRLTLSTALKKISKKFRELEGPAEAVKTVAERPVATKPRVVRYRRDSSPTLRSVAQKRAFSCISRAAAHALHRAVPDLGNDSDDGLIPTLLYNHKPSDSSAWSTEPASASEYEDASEYLDTVATPVGLECAATGRGPNGRQDFKSGNHDGVGDSDDSVNDLDFQIPPQTLRAALGASPNSAGAFWKHTMYRSSTGKSIRMHYCRRRVDAEKIAQHFLHDPIIGFDMEWEVGAKPEAGNIKRSVSLVQIANEDRIALFHIALFEEDSADALMPQCLRQILESSNIVKTGVNIANDFTRLRKCFDIEGRGIFELSHLYNLVKHSDSQRHLVTKKTTRLATQVQDILHLPLKKDAVRVSAWSKKLDMEQCEYAATDAYAGFRLYHALEAARKRMEPMPPRPALHELKKPLILGDGTEATK